MFIYLKTPSVSYFLPLSPGWKTYPECAVLKREIRSNCLLASAIKSQEAMQLMPLYYILIGTISHATQHLQLIAPIRMQLSCLEKLLNSEPVVLIQKVLTLKMIIWGIPTTAAWQRISFSIQEHGVLNAYLRLTLVFVTCDKIVTYYTVDTPT